MEKDAIIELLDSFDAGIIGEEADGSFRVAFSRTCEMVNMLVEALQELGYDICFPPSETSATTLFMNISPLSENTKSVSHDLLSDFTWLPNKMGQYTFSKKAMHGVNLRQLFLQLEANFIPSLLEDEPGTDQIYLHVERRGPDRSSGKKSFSSKQKTESMKWILVFISLPIIITLLAFYAQHTSWEGITKLWE